MPDLNRQLVQIELGRLACRDGFQLLAFLPDLQAVDQSEGIAEPWDNARLTEEVKKLKQELAALRKQPLNGEQEGSWIVHPSHAG